VPARAGSRRGPHHSSAGLGVGGEAEGCPLAKAADDPQRRELGHGAMLLDAGAGAAWRDGALLASKTGLVFFAAWAEDAAEGAGRFARACHAEELEAVAERALPGAPFALDLRSAAIPGTLARRVVVRAARRGALGLAAEPGDQAQPAPPRVLRADHLCWQAEAACSLFGLNSEPAGQPKLMTCGPARADDLLSLLLLLSEQVLVLRPVDEEKLAVEFRLHRAQATPPPY
jgi:hypothetical protein